MEKKQTDIKQVFNKIKANKYAVVGTSAFGSLMIGVGITGLVMSPSYVYIVGNVKSNLGSKSAAEKWIAENIETTSETFKNIGNDYLIHEDQWSDYIYSIYLGLHPGNNHFYTDETITFDENGLATGVSNARLETDLGIIYKTSTGTIVTTTTDAVATFLKSNDVYRNEFTGSAYNAHFATEAEAEENWLDTKEANQSVSQRTEYQYDGSTWDADESVERDKLTIAEEAKIVHHPEVAGTPGTETDYLGSGEYITNRDAWILANGTVDVPVVEDDYKASPEYASDVADWIADNPDFGGTFVSAKWEYDGHSHSSLALAESAVSAYVDTQRQTRIRYSYDSTAFDYDSVTEAKTAYRGTLTASGEASMVTFYYSDGDIIVNHSTNQADVETGIEARLSSKEGFEATAAATGDYDDYSVELVYYYNYNSADLYFESQEDIAIKFEEESAIASTDVIVDSYNLAGTENKFDSEEELIEFWTSQIKKVKE